MKFDSEYEDRGFFQKYGFGLGIGLVVLAVGGLVVGQMLKGNTSLPRPVMQEVVIIRPLPPPPPPPPRPPDPPKEIEKMVEQTPVDDEEKKPDDTPKDLSPPALTTGLSGPGSDAFGLGAGGRGGTGGGNGGGPRSRFGWYAAEIQRAFQDALNRNRITSMASFDNEARIWADESGRVTRVRIVGSTGDPAVDEAIRDALSGIQLQDPPPAGMPMPIHLRLGARRPG